MLVKELQGQFWVVGFSESDKAPRGERGGKPMGIFSTGPFTNMDWF